MSKLDKYLNNLRGKNILIQGLGLNGGGLGVAKFFLENGFKIKITDLKNEDDLKDSILELKDFEDNIEYVLGKHDEDDFRKADIVVKGPGVPPTNKFIKIAIENKAEIISDIEIFLNITDAKVYAVTGSKGKSTSVSLIYNIFQKESKNSFLGGNITISPLNFYKETDKDSLVILELSSWQLRDLKGKNFRFLGAGITNLLCDHQNYYANMIDYLNDKKIITENQTNYDFLIIPYNDYYLNTKNIKTEARVFYYDRSDKKANFYYKDSKAFFSYNNKEIEIFEEILLKIYGEHNKLNALFSAGFCYLAGIKPENIKNGIADFKGAPFRLELIREINGVKFINDTTATMPDASYFAIKSFNSPVIWIAGGNDKNLDFSILEKVRNIPKKILLLPGNGTERMKKILNRDDIIENDSLEFLIKKAFEYAEKGDIILFSPGCTSFGLFQNEFDRGRKFNNIVNSL
ncbi:MAG TPA: UDP-N-acetylmuramoyl-L-alanine--D-glutamate ligase [Spirochaetota bacterium]|nr:UDP-N-acetylmuramoyl-L-alanine--D-glutamate ligase [Spirochaetota bacterium]HOL57703.1 UDP-N-acetylmuramoyl-L-alanine--D-glutamate ligase [Spirochaetota bacterium]HPP04095.1 UDP-N-acetylmuramoyl-L-alanine--D-glutamate ligase [Spirochaetota bacterium]